MFAEGERERVGGRINGGDAEGFGGEAQAVAVKQGFDGLFGQSESVHQFFVDAVDLPFALADGEAFVEDEALVNVGAVVFRQ